MDLRPLKVTAYTPEGFVTDNPWTPTLDGILSHCLKEVGGTKSLNPRQPIDGLPIEVVEWGDLWWYVVSSPVSSPAMFRFEDICERGGRKYVLVNKSKRASWYAMGDAAQMKALLARCTHIGRHPGHTFGQVVRWEVAADTRGEAIARFKRPLPVDYAMAYAVPSAFLMVWGICPPAWVKAHQCMCAMPEWQVETDEEIARIGESDAKERIRSET